MGFRLQEMTLNNLERQFTALLITRFRYKVALYFIQLRFKFDDRIQRESLRISSIIWD